MRRHLSFSINCIAAEFTPSACGWSAIRRTRKISRRSLGGEDASCAWLQRVAVTVVRMRLGKNSLPATSLEVRGAPDVGAADLRLSGAVDRVNLERSIERLPPGYKTVFVLHDVQGYEHNEIADIMGCSVGNSKSQLHKARTRLRELLQEEVREQARQERHAAKAQTADND